MCSDRLETRLKKGLEQRRAEDLYRSRQVRESAQGAYLQLGDQRYLNFCSNDYLGLANHPQMITRAKSTLDEYGVGSGASALISGYTELHQRLELVLAELTNRSRSLLFSSGFSANSSILSVLVCKGDELIMDRQCHASLIDGARLSAAKIQRYPHLDMADLSRRLSRAYAQKRPSWLISESLFSMDGDQADLVKLAQLANTNAADFVLDDAHGFGIYGEDGAGSLSAAGLDQRQVPVLIGTFGKALGASGAFVAGSEDLIESLIQEARSSIYSTAMPAAIVASVLTALELIKSEPWRRQRLFESIDYFRHHAGKKGIPLADSASGPIQPIIIGSNERVLQIGEKLCNMGIKVGAIRPPTVAVGTARLRITFSASHQESHIDQLIQGLVEAL